MSDLGLKMMGRDSDGKAKAVKTNDDGIILMTVVGNDVPKLVAGRDIGYKNISPGESFVIDEFELAKVKFKEVYYVLGFTLSSRSFMLEWIGVRNKEWDVENKLWVQYFREDGILSNTFVFDEAIIIDPRSRAKDNLMLITTLKLSPGGTDQRLVLTNTSSGPIVLRRGFRMEVY